MQTLDSIPTSGRKTERVKTPSKMKTAAQGLEFQGEVRRKALGAPLKNTRAVCSVIDWQRNGSSPT